MEGKGKKVYQPFIQKEVPKRCQ